MNILDEKPTPLVVDLDGTLVRSDLLVESFFGLVGQSPGAGLASLRHLARGKAAFKSHIGERVEIDVASLPFDERVLAHIAKAQAAGRPIYLASASNERYVRALAERLDCFAGSFGSTGTVNLSGARKRDRLVAEFGKGGFDYVGNDTADLPVWEASRTPVVVNAPGGLVRRLKARFDAVVDLGPARSGARVYIRALRVHQWLKNFLVFVPLVTSHSFNLAAFAVTFRTFVAMSFCASSAYLLNDIFDLSDDRRHPTKRNRPLASGQVPILSAVVLVPILLAAGLAIAGSVSPALLALVGFYYLTTVSYSTFLKRMMLVDVLVLAGCYTLRILAGGVALSLPLSPWLVAFSGFLFLGLAIIKRYIELIARLNFGSGESSRRSYQKGDMPVLAALGASSAFSAVLVFALYINAPETAVLYGHPLWLWLIVPLLVYWLGRLLMLAQRGEVHDDPVVFTATDPTSLVVMAAGLSLLLFAI